MRRRILFVLGSVIVFVVFLENIEGPVSRVKSLWPIIKTVSERAEVDPYLVAAMVHAESGGDPEAGTREGPVGLLQLLPPAVLDATGNKDLGLKVLKDPVTNLSIGTKYLALLLERFGEERLAISAFRLGPTRIQKDMEKAGGRKRFLEGFRDHPAYLYTKKVLNLRELYKKILK